MRILFELTVQLYEILLRVDRSVEQLQHQDAVCDLLYHIKYQFTGDSVKADAERVVRQLRSSLQLRLRSVRQSRKYFSILTKYFSLQVYRPGAGQV